MTKTQMQHQTRKMRRGQSGFLMLEASLALLLGVIAAALAYWSSQRGEWASQAMTQADHMQNVAAAAEGLVMAHYDDYQRGLPITQNGITLDWGAAPGEALQPTIANLRAMALGLTPGGLNQGSYKSLENANYQINIERSPAGCELVNNGVNCNIAGTVCMDRPVNDLGAAAGETDGFGIGKILGKLGGDGGVSLAGSNANITGTGAAWSVPNPIAATPVGIVCARFGFGSANFANFLRVRDSRDPDFQGNFTVAGTATFNNNVNVVDNLSGCIRAGITPGNAGQGGTLFARNAACVQTILNEGETGTISATGEVQVRDGAGVVVAALKPDGTVVSNTRSIAPTSKITASYAAGAACAAAFANDVAQNASNPGLVVCRNNIWTPVGMTVSSLGQACNVEGAAGIALNGLGLFCQGGLWIANADRIGHFAVQDSWVGHTGTFAPKPVCASNGIPRIMYAASGGEFAPNVGARSVFYLTQDVGAQWLLRVIDGNGAAVTDGQGLVSTGCWYN